KTNEKKQKRNYYEETELQILNFIDNQLVNLAKQYGALIREYPTLLSYENMVKNNYHKNFPQNIYSPFEIEHNYKLIEEIRNQTEKNIKDETFKSSGYFLQPCICYHCYEELQDCNIENIVFTGKGKCYRHEVEWKKSTYRKNEFYMREIVYFGEKNNVLKIRENLIKEVWAFFKELNLVGKIETATDPFFFYDDMKKSTYQLMTEAKYELVAKISEEKDISIASFNFCNNNLCDAYNIRNSKEELLFSGCTAFGLDRWVALILNTLGEDLDKWPERIRNKLYECNPK
ncbi:aminoacyl--tRNA ligase-related protein, partial [Planococcus sp. Urea-trap-24]